MKTKRTPFVIARFILIFALAVLLLAFCVHLYVVKVLSVKTDSSEVNAFLTDFKTKAGETDSKGLLKMFDPKLGPKNLNRLVGILTGTKDYDTVGNSLAKIEFDIDGSTENKVSESIVLENIPVKFTYRDLETSQSVLILKIKKIKERQYKIIQVDAKKFLLDYSDFIAYVKSKTLPDKDLFSPQTLVAFKAAERLKSKYDSVIWFSYVDKKTFYYVVKGNWDLRKDLGLERRRDKTVERGDYKMGLVGPDFTEIIPPEYDLIHNINGTFPGLVEVEKGKSRGFFDLTGKEVVPVKYDQIFPLEDELNLAVLKDSSNYYYLGKDLKISEKVDLKISDFFSKIKNISNLTDLANNTLSQLMEYNSRIENGAVYIPPSYLFDLNLVEKELDFKNTTRKASSDDDEIHEKYLVKNNENIKGSENFFEASFFAIRDYFLGGRVEFYDRKKVVIVDKKKDRIFTQEIPIDESDGENYSALDGTCDVNSIRAINDSLFEIKTGTVLSMELYNSSLIVGGPYYRYYSISGDKLTELRVKRNFGFTKYVKMDDSYLNGCYQMLIGKEDYGDKKTKTLNVVTPEMLRYMKNEIYAEYMYKFKDKKWMDIFRNRETYDRNGNVNTKFNAKVDDSLTEIDKYNINWINQKLKGVKTQGQTLAVK